MYAKFVKFLLMRKQFLYNLKLDDCMAKPVQQLSFRSVIGVSTYVCMYFFI